MGTAKLTTTAVVEARLLHEEGWRYTALAQRYGVNHSTIRVAVLGKTWKHV